MCPGGGGGGGGRGKQLLRRPVFYLYSKSLLNIFKRKEFAPRMGIFEEFVKYVYFP